MSTLRRRVNPDYQGQPAVTVYVTPTCVNCPKTLRVLRDHNISHTVVDLTKDKAAYSYVTQELKFKAAPVVDVHHRFEQNTWSGHHLDLIDEHIIAHYQHETDEDRMAQAAANTTSVLRNSGLGRSTGPHLHFDTHTKEDQA